MEPAMSRRLAQVFNTPYFSFLRRINATELMNQLTEEANDADSEDDLSEDMKTLIKAADRSVEIAAEQKTDDFMAIANQVNAELGTRAEDEDEDEGDDEDESDEE